MSTAKLVPWSSGVLPRPMAEPSLRGIALASILVIVIGFGGLLGWASVARVDSAVPAPGVIVAAAKRKTVTLLDSGLLQSLAVREGDRVTAGQVLLRLDDVQARSSAGQAHAQYWAAVVRLARLDAEARDSRTMPLPDDLAAASSGTGPVAAQLDAERKLFAARWEAFDGTARIGRRKMAEQQAQIAAADEQAGLYRTRIGLLVDELRGVEYLLARGFATKVHAFELRRAEAELRGALSDLTGRSAQAREVIAQTEAEMANAAESRRSDIAKERADTQALREDAAQRLRAARDLLARREILAPEAGTVTDIKFFTPGSSIGAGQPILDIVPTDASMVVEASVAPTDIEHVHVGQRVGVRLSAYKQHKVPVLPGRLTYVGADRQSDAQNNPIFLARAELEPDALATLPGVALYAGMPADVLIIGGERTVLDFLLSPIRDSLRHGMVEE